MDALIIVRLVFGLLMAGHGAQKLFGWLGGYGLDGTGGFFEGIGFRPGKLFAAAAGAAEFTGGLLVALGLLGPVGPALILSVMLVAIFTVHAGKGLFAASGGIEVPALYAAAAVTLALTGPGAFAFDELFGLTPLWTPEVRLAALGVGVLGAVANLAIRRPAPQAVSA
jgi:putative oxidoreductase